MLLSATPPGVGSLNVVVAPIHIVLLPVIADIALPTVIGILAEHAPTVYEIVAPPEVAPVTTPAPETVAIEVLLTLHTPPGVASLNDSDAPTHMLVGPVIPEKCSNRYCDTYQSKILLCRGDVSGSPGYSINYTRA